MTNGITANRGLVVPAATIVAHLGGNADTAINTAHTAVMNNYLSDWQKKQKALELGQCAHAMCETITRLRWQAVDTGQDASFALGQGNRALCLIINQQHQTSALT
ncbi:hypothetical protein [Pasteurella testudinis]|uniref:hypothetical protein n=1 Tax=Pasteurella testudinis TaxID=761 RepID=UPI004058CE0C